VQRRIDGVWSTIATPTEPGLTIWNEPGTTRFRVRATDRAGNVGSWVSSQPLVMAAYQESDGVVFDGTWKQATPSSVSGGALRYSGMAGRSATITFTGNSVAWVSTVGPSRGIARVFVDGVLVRSVDLYAPALGARRVVYARNGLPDGVHTIRIEVTGTRNAASSGNRVDLDAFVVLD
jgi:hypothetical protein